MFITVVRWVNENQQLQQGAPPDCFLGKHQLLSEMMYSFWWTDVKPPFFVLSIMKLDCQIIMKLDILGGPHVIWNVLKKSVMWKCQKAEDKTEQMLLLWYYCNCHPEIRHGEKVSYIDDWSIYLNAQNSWDFPLPLDQNGRSLQVGPR